MSSRLTTERTDPVPGYVVADITLSSRRVGHVDWSIGISNMFDTKYRDPVGEEHAQKSIQQDGRAFRVKLAYGF